MMIAGHTTPKKVRIAAILTFAVATVIGIYFAIISHWTIFALVGIGGLTIIFYTEGLARIMLGELFAGLTLGSLVVIGTYIAMTATPGKELSELVPTVVIIISIPPGILTSLLLLMNEFPDVEADKTGGRLHLVVKLGKKNAAIVYCIGILLTFGVIVIIPFLNLTSYWIYLALIPLPMGIKACYGLLKNMNDSQKLIPSLGDNVITMLATDLLIAISIML
jgi:1,4-dihydroxy-2-naphthoate octaprenyltransferase